MGSPSKRRLAPTGEPGHRSCLRPKLGAQRLGAGPPSSPDCRDGLVHYFWGIPFCPSGLQPDQYTGVIVCQLQAYERCLKLAQSRLLRKAQFGPPVLPQPEPQQGEEPARRNWQADRSKAAELSRESERLDATDNQPQTSNVCAEEIPEDEGGQNSEDEAEGSRDTSSCASPHVHPDAAVLFIGTETQQSSSEEMNPVSETPRRSVSDSAQEPEDVVLIEDEADEFQPTPSKKSYVECPICSHKFPSEKIEVHAADCNDTCDGGSQLQVQTRSHTRRVAKQNGTDGSNYTTLRLYCCYVLPYQKGQWSPTTGLRIGTGP
ncbi:BRCA1-A complex subunit RAP80 isoform X1 [Hypanus sabinus]|uniref:BRCA1-A complex subunit RAP80 isoform X1 n=1 Tax=Hypanus sabinus TaxID=79690 RepID=UPI0028C4DC3C|nr:BRCA1-A complex subunit RAP80 isoform X1 [Hypanus sabinus]